jgi:DNA invertase Pin-like site-specific DNA recombinase
MAEGKFVAYYRVSTDRQGQSGLGLEAQRSAVTAYLNGGSWRLVAEFTEMESGKRADRPVLAEALAACKRHKATLVIAKLDRLARNVAFIANLMDAGVDFVAVDFPTANRLTLHILAAVAEHEAKMISSRTKEALAAAKARGVKLGGPKLAEAQVMGRAVVMAEADRHAANVLPVIRAIEAAGVTGLVHVAAALNARGIKTRRGGSWYASTVRNLLARSIRVEG